MSPIGQKQRPDHERRVAAKKPIDRRVARTRGMLHEALLSLIIEKGYEAVSVEDICERANVGRSTFYAHFTGKDDLKRSGLGHLRQATPGSCSDPDPLHRGTPRVRRDA